MLGTRQRAEPCGGAGQIWDVQQGFVEQAIVNTSGFSQLMRGLREKAMYQAKGTACTKAQR